MSWLRLVAVASIVCSSASACVVMSGLDKLSVEEPDLTRDADHPSRADASTRELVDASAKTSTVPEADTSVDAGDGASSYPSTVIADRPLGYWRLGESAGATVAVDEMNAVNGGVEGNGTVTFGLPGALPKDPNTAAAFDGNRTYIAFGSGFEFTERRAFSIEAWVKPTTLTGAEQRIASRRGNGGADGYRLIVTPQGEVAIERWRDAVVTLAKASGLSTLDYTYVVGTYDGSTLCIYVNGTLASSTPDTTLVKAATARFAIGAGANGDEPLTGLIDEVAIFDRALSATEIGTHFRASHR